MATDANDPEITARATLALLETRLHRLEFLLTGSSNEDGVPHPTTKPAHSRETVWAKLDALEAELGKLKKVNGPAGTVVRDLDRLCGRSILKTSHLSDVQLMKALDTMFPDLFASVTTTSAIPKSEDLSTLASIVLSHATLFPETASRLSSLQTLQVPRGEQSVKLISLIPRLDKCQEDEQHIQDEVRELRERSARCLDWWVKTGVIGMGDLWENWERRITQVERSVIRFERRAKEEQGYL
ncbi:uncharacterized protein Z518_01600 [Rhinocladiella mackenziei CBS 650.93]|uniref:Nuclear distribution protein RO10 n=1 Tax=Rhinocladiella mackenziei CBS 650.93 TaxID=1442369 RepID=A0A0D2G6E1_9EURO|nr:uncharacterized protein Z518_01600 [Rhinocladiella mackenziei CBS 650.93]KIX10517.1 hypothetical protein Z518_01600 [Rhinocladiella mackenziei CBS 650.93]